MWADGAPSAGCVCVWCHAGKGKWDFQLPLPASTDPKTRHFEVVIHQEQKVSLHKGCVFCTAFKGAQLQQSILPLARMLVFEGRPHFGQGTAGLSRTRGGHPEDTEPPRPGPPSQTQQPAEAPPPRWLGLWTA